MPTAKNHRALLAFTAIFAAGLLATGAAMAQTPAESDCRWQADFTEQLGIDPASEPLDGQPIRTVKAVVTDPDRLASLGLFAARLGDRISMLCIGSDIWRIKHYATGRAITFSTRPF